MLKVVNSNNKDMDARSVMSQAKFYESYSRWDDNLERYESWDESVIRVMDMHRNFYKDKMDFSGKYHYGEIGCKRVCSC